MTDKEMARLSVAGPLKNLNNITAVRYRPAWILLAVKISFYIFPHLADSLSGLTFLTINNKFFL